MLTKDVIEKVIDDVDLEKLQAKHREVVLTKEHVRALLRLSLCACSVGEFMGTVSRATSDPGKISFMDTTAMSIGFAQAMALLFPHPDELAASVKAAGDLIGIKLEAQAVYGQASDKVH